MILLPYLEDENDTNKNTFIQENTSKYSLEHIFSNLVIFTRVVEEGKIEGLFISWLY